MSSFLGPDGPVKPVRSDSKVSAAGELLNEENYETKTEIIHPTALSVLELFAAYAQGPEVVRSRLGLPPEQPINLGHWYALLIKLYKINMIDKNRKSREEYTRSLQAIQSDESSISTFKKIFGTG